MGEAMGISSVEGGTHGFDASQKLTADTAKSLRQAGFRFAIRYLSRKASPPPTDLTADEVELILDADLGLMAVQHVAQAPWQPTEELGIAYGKNAVSHAKSVNLPLGTSVWLDLEEVGAAPVNDVISYSNAWFREVEAGGYTTGVYVGSNSNLSGELLFLRLITQRYWKSGSNVPDIPHRGYCMVQHIIQDDAVAGVKICRDVTAVDAFGNAPMVAMRGRGSVASLALPLQPIAPATDLRQKQDEEATLRALARQEDLAEPMERLLDFRDRQGAPTAARYWAIADFDRRSSQPRLFVFDTQSQQVQSYLCAHGKGSEGPTDDGYANVFSNTPNSNCTSLGIYKCAEPYRGKHGFSMRLDGLEATNSNARARSIVVHGADYVSPQFIEHYGRIGRSNGCFALEPRFVTEVVDALSGGSLLIAWHTGG